MRHEKPTPVSPADHTTASITIPSETFIRSRILEISHRNDNPVVLDLFAGAGGLSLGFKAAGFRVIGACEIDEWACETIQHNFPDETVVSGDIRAIDNTSIRDRFGRVDVIIGGPPCQGFSMANNAARKVDDPRNSLFIEYLRFVKVMAPEVVVVENVAGLVTKRTAGGPTYLEAICNELEKLGYHASWSVLNAQDHGVPQLRPRLIIVGSRARLKTPHPVKSHKMDAIQASLLDNLPPHNSLWSAISDLPYVQAREGAEEMDYENSAQNPLQHLLRAGSERVYNHKAMLHSKRLVSRFSQVRWGECGADVGGEFAVRARNGTGAGKKFYQNNRRNHPFKPSHTLPASFYANFIHPFIDRNYTAREGARLQTFPDWYCFKGKPTVVSQRLLAREGRSGEMHLCQYNQIGNAVPPLLAYEIAKNLRGQI